MDWRFFNGPMITTQTQTLVPRHAFPVSPAKFTPPRPTLKNGIGLGGFWDEVFAEGFVDPADKASIEASDAKLAQINDAALARGAVSQEVHDETAQHIEDTNYDAIINDPDMSVFRAAVDGAQEGLLNDLAITKKAIQSVSTGVFGAIPVQVYALVAVALVGLYFIKKR